MVNLTDFFIVIVMFTLVLLLLTYGIYDLTVLYYNLMKYILIKIYTCFNSIIL